MLQTVTALTPRQREVLKALHAGQRPPQIAQAMRVNQTTVREHTKHIKRFYEVEARGERAYQEAIQKAKRRGDL